MVLAAPAPYDESIAETVGSSDVAKAQEDNKFFLLDKLGWLSIVLGWDYKNIDF